MIFLHTQCKDRRRGGVWNCQSNVEQVSPVGRLPQYYIHWVWPFF